MAATAVVAGACSASSTADPAVETTPPTAVESSPPSIEGVQVITAGTTATIVASVASTDDVASVSVDWGDGSVSTVTDGFPLVRADHVYEVSGAYAVSLLATGVDGTTSVVGAAAVIDEIPGAMATTTSPPVTDPPPTDPPATDPPRTDPPRTDPPRTDPPSTEPPPTTTPAPEPFSLDLSSGQYATGSGQEPDGAGGSGEYRRVADNVVAVRSFAHHGYNGSGSAEGSIRSGYDLSDVFGDLPDSVVALEVTVDWSASASGVLKHPWDRTAAFTLTAELNHAGPNGVVDTDLFVAIDEYREGDDDRPTSTPAFDGGGTLTVVATREAPVVEFALIGRCSSWSGPMAFALLNEGYCDFYDAGSIALDSLSATVTPIVAG